MTVRVTNRSDNPLGRQAWSVPLAVPLAAIVALLFVISLGVGDFPLSIAEIASGLVGAGSPDANTIVQDIRLPRAILGVLIGATLGLGGAALQGLLRNPLASPSLFGAPAAAAFVAVTVISLNLVDTLSNLLPLAAIAGAAASVGLLVLVAGARASLLMLILAGLAVGALGSAGTALVLNLSARPDNLEIAFWLLGSLEDRSMQHVTIALPFILVGWLLMSWDRGAFRALTLGESAAESMGVSLQRVRLRVVIGVAAGVGAAVSVSGAIAFVGLVAPNLVRPFTRFDPARLLLPSALAGAALLLASDILVRIIPTQQQIKVGVITTLVGAPFFVAMVLRRRTDAAGTSG